jgi:hypothetical protein
MGERLAGGIELLVAGGERRAQGEDVLLVLLVECVFEALGVCAGYLREKNAKHEDDGLQIHGWDSLNRVALMPHLFSCATHKKAGEELPCVSCMGGFQEG